MGSARWAATSYPTSGRGLIPLARSLTAGRRHLTIMTRPHTSKRFVRSSVSLQTSRLMHQTLIRCRRSVPPSLNMKMARNHTVLTSYQPASAPRWASLSCQPAINATPAMQHSTPPRRKRRPLFCARLTRSAGSSRPNTERLSIARFATPPRLTCEVLSSQTRQGS